MLGGKPQSKVTRSTPILTGEECRASMWLGQLQYKNTWYVSSHDPEQCLCAETVHKESYFDIRTHKGHLGVSHSRRFVLKKKGTYSHWSRHSVQLHELMTSRNEAVCFSKTNIQKCSNWRIWALLCLQCAEIFNYVSSSQLKYFKQWQSAPLNKQNICGNFLFKQAHLRCNSFNFNSTHNAATSEHCGIRLKWK